MKHAQPFGGFGTFAILGDLLIGKRGKSRREFQGIGDSGHARCLGRAFDAADLGFRDGLIADGALAVRVKRYRAAERLSIPENGLKGRWGLRGRDSVPGRFFRGLRPAAHYDKQAEETQRNPYSSKH